MVARIFLCHASDDKPQVRDVYYRLKAEGFDPWLDTKDLLPGQEWDLEIEVALEQSDFVMVFLSKRSVGKRGYVQREFRRVMYHSEEMPEGHIHTIPVKLDDCEVPRRFSRRQWVNLNDEGAFDLIVRALHHGLRQRGAQIPIRPKSQDSSLLYIAPCIVSPNSVKAILELNESRNIYIHWHERIQIALARLKDWYDNFPERVTIFRWAVDYKNSSRAGHTTELQAQISKDYQDTKRIEEFLQLKFVNLLELVSKADLEFRESAILSYAGFASLYLIKHLQQFEYRLINSQVSTVYGYPPFFYVMSHGEWYLNPEDILMFRDLKVVPHYLVETYEKPASLAKLALSHIWNVDWDQFMVCRIYKADQRDYERIVLPKFQTERLDRYCDRERAPQVYYELVLPQWLVRGFDGLPDVDSWRIFVVEDQHQLYYTWPD